MPWVEANGLFPGRGVPGRGIPPSDCAGLATSAGDGDSLDCKTSLSVDAAGAGATSANISAGAFSIAAGNLGVGAVVSDAVASDAVALEVFAAGVAAPGAFAAASFSAGALGAVIPSASSAAFSLRATGGSILEDGPLTNSPISLSFSRALLLSMPSSDAISCTRGFATILLSGDCPKREQT